MEILLADIQALFALFTGAINTITALIVALVVVLAFVAPFYEMVRYERGWWDNQ